MDTWCSDTEILLDELDGMEKKFQDLTSGKQDEAVEEDKEKETEKKKRERMKAEKEKLTEDMIKVVENLSVS